MIESLTIGNFKSIGSSHIEFSKFNCLIGMNSAGKSTLLQAFDFVARQMTGDVEEWLSDRGWQAKDLSCKLRKEQNITFKLNMTAPPSGMGITWFASFNKKELRCTFERFSVTSGTQKTLFFSDGQHYTNDLAEKREIGFTYQGSILSQLKDTELPPELRIFRDTIRHIKSLELLSPHLLRKQARDVKGDIGVGGEKLSAYLHGIKGDDRKALIALLKQFYPSIVEFKVSALRAGWKKLSIIEAFGDHRIETDASHINDGLLRILAMLAQTRSDRSLVLLDEIENGINPEIVEKLVDILVESDQQIIVTSHSPMILNYLADDVARTAVQFVYKSPQGLTSVRRFFDIPRVAKKLAYMGPGEAFVDTNLRELTAECVAQDAADTTAATLTPADGAP